MKRSLKDDDSMNKEQIQVNSGTTDHADDTVVVRLRPKEVSLKRRSALVIDEHTVEIVSDSGEGAQKCGQSFGAIAARMGAGVWTVEIIPAEIQPPARSIEGASGNRIRLASRRVTNGGDEADLIVAFNDQVMLRRSREHELKPGCTVLLENKWKTHPDSAIAAMYADAEFQALPRNRRQGQDL